MNHRSRTNKNIVEIFQRNKSYQKNRKKILLRVFFIHENFINYTGIQQNDGVVK